MSAKLGTGFWGRGVRHAPSEGSGGTPSAGSGLTDEQIARLLGSDAKEAIDSLAIGNEADKLPDVGEVTFPGPIAEAYYWSDADVVGIQGPVGSGKTTTKMKRKLRRAIMMPTSQKDRVAWLDGEWRTIQKAEEADLRSRGVRTSGWRRYKVLFIRETYRQLWSTTIPSYLESYPRSFGTWSGGRGDPVTHRIQFEDEFGPIEFVAEFMAFGDDIVASMRGVQTTDIDLNEADTMPVEILTVGIGRIDRHPARDHFEGLANTLRSYGQIDCDFNAPDEDNWTFNVFHDEEERTRMAEALSAELPEGVKRIEIAFFNQPGYGQPGAENLQNLSPTYYPRQIASMKLAGRGDMIDRLVYNKVVYLRAGDPVFSREFNRAVHVGQDALPLIHGVPLRIGLDQGFKGAAVIAQFVSPFHWRIYAELHFPKERLLAKVFGARLSDLLSEPRFSGYRVEAGWSDMAGEHGASQAADENATWNRLVAKAADISIRPQRIGTNRIQPRLEAVRAPLEYLDAGQPGLLIDPSCKFLIRGFAARYVWAEEIDRNGDKRKVPDKRFTEANVMDALQYLLLSEHRGDGTSPISDTGRPGAAQRGPMGRPQPETGGLSTNFDVLNPY